MKTGFILATALVFLTACQRSETPSSPPSPAAEKAAPKSGDNTPLPDSFIAAKTPASIVKVNARMKSGVELLGYSVEPNLEPTPGGSFTVTWYWRSNGPVESGWSFFTHLVDGQGNLVASQNDRGVLRSKFSPHRWPVGRIIADAEVIAVPSSWRSNTLDVRTGLWRGNERMPVGSGPVDEEDRIRGPVVDVRLRPVPSTSAAASDLSLDIPWTQRPPIIDGRSDGDPAWNDAAVLGAFTDPVSGNAVPGSIEVKLIIDQRNLYVYMNAEDKELRTGGLKKDEDLFGADAFVILLQPDPASTAYYEIQINPAGVVYDAHYPSWRKADVSFRSGIRLRTIVDGTPDDAAEEDISWSLEAAIPLSALGSDVADFGNAASTWRANFFRVDRGTGEAVFSAWSAPMRGDFHTLNRFGRIRFSISPKSR